MIDELSKICKIETNIDLKKYNTFKLHCIADVICFINNYNELVDALNVIKKYNSKWFIIGNGSNVILPNHYNGVIIKLSGFNNYEINDCELYAEANCMINKLATKVARLGYGGIDFACGIPGSIGGCIYGNAGCYGSDISKILVSAKVFDGDKIIEFTNEDFKFDYRYSMLKENKKYIILSAKFKLYKSDKNILNELILERNKKRLSTQPLQLPSNGSVFRNPEGLIAGKLIDESNLKGTRIGDAVVSDKHANFIVNEGNATCEDIIKLINLIKKEVKKNYDIDLILEQEIIK